MEYKIGTNYNGFVLVREENIKEVNSIARIFAHVNKKHYLCRKFLKFTI